MASSQLIQGSGVLCHRGVFNTGCVWGQLGYKTVGVLESVPWDIPIRAKKIVYSILCLRRPSHLLPPPEISILRISEDRRLLDL
jgi:hypothetical protein